MSQWKAGDLLLAQARVDSDWRGVHLRDRYHALGRDAEVHDKMALAGASAGAIAVCGMATVAALTSSAVLAPVAASVVLCALLGTAAGSAFLALGAKALAVSERSHQSKLTTAVSELERGFSVRSVIERLGGDKIAAKLGGWRHLREKPEPAEPARRHDM